MNKVLVDYKELEKIRQLEVLDSGFNGTCYFLNETTLIKIFHVLLKKRNIYFSDLESNNIAFPKEIYYMDTGLVLGYTMDYFNGEEIITGLKEDLLLKDLKNAIIEMKKEILKYPNVCMEDLSLVNMLFDYNTKRIQLIDTSEWHPEENSSQINLEKFNSKMMRLLTRTNLNWLNHPLNQHRSLQEIYRMYKSGIESLPLTFLEELEFEISKRKGFKVKTLGDLTL